MKKNKIIDKITVALGIIMYTGFVVFIFFTIYKVNKIKKNPAITIGTVIDKVENRGMSLIYEYEVNGVLYKKSDSHTFQHTNFNKFKGKKFLVVYSIKHPNYSDLLIFPQEYENYNIPYPDSLNWILECK